MQIRSYINQKSVEDLELFPMLEPEFDALYDLLYQVFGDEQTSLELLQSILRQATRRYRREQYTNYLRLWIYSLCTRSIQARYPRFLAELASEHNTSYPFLSLEEKLVLMLHDRVALSADEIAACLRISVGRMGRSLAYAREKLARHALELDWSRGEKATDCPLNSLLARVDLNRNFGSKHSHNDCVACDNYLLLIGKSRGAVLALPRRYFAEIESSVRATKLMPIFRKPKEFRWISLSWRWKLGAEIAVLGVIASLAVFVAPWGLSHINTRALYAGHFANVFEVDRFISKEPELPEINAERLLASTDIAEQEMSGKSEEKDEFAAVDFPSGDAYETGAAPLAPSRQSAAVFRLIVQSPSPRDLIPEMKKLFAQQKVKERESSGRIMPGGVYFDGITTVGSYSDILGQIKKLGITKTYSNPSSGRGNDERARLIVWIQQI